MDFDEDCDEARVDVGLAAAEVMEAYSKASVTVLVLSVVMVVGVGTVWASVNVSTMVVSPEGASAVTIVPMAAVSVAMPGAPIEEGSSVFGFPMLEGRSEVP